MNFQSALVSNTQVLFIKDVIGSNEICCWSFYGHGKRIAEVCCTAIVYSPDRKNTKVEFPEARQVPSHPMMATDHFSPNPTCQTDPKCHIGGVCVELTQQLVES